ncbi:hypothetical protein HAX54_030409 [Datura stramonium]|uniref:RRP12-like protein n=1 Tax=Datura stramonium TaxID=4076 RepID=A0ABS8V8X8_DATST|nr:hypothetical protein [Datura stramonium]
MLLTSERVIGSNPIRVPHEAVSSDKAAEAIGVLVGLLEKQPLESEGVLGTSTFPTDKRPKVRKCAQDCILTVFKSFGSSSVAKKAGKRIYSLIKEHITLAIKLSAPKEISGSKDELSRGASLPKYPSFIIPYLTVKDNEKLFWISKRLIYWQSCLLCSLNWGGVLTSVQRLQECIGSAVIAMGPEKLLALLPISLNTKDYSFSNSWLIPVLNKYLCGSSLGFFMKHVVPLAVSVEKASTKVKKSVIREELQAYARGCWGLLPAFCRCPSDFHKNAQALTTLLIPFLKEDSFMLENISAALQELVNKSKNVLASDNFSGEHMVHQTENKNLDLALEFKRKCSYSKKSASKNIKALASCSEEWLQALINVFFESSPAKYQQFKEAIECLTSITDSSLTQSIFTSSMERAGITNDIGEYKKLGLYSTDNKENNSTLLGEVAKRCMILELGSCFVEGSSDDLIKVLFGIARDVLEATHGAGHLEAYHILSRILEKHSWFHSSHAEQLMELLTSVKPPTDIKSLTSRFACYKTLLIDAIQGNLDEENTEAFLILNEIILALKDSTEEGRKTAYDALISVCSSLRDSSSAKSNESYKKFVDMVIAYLSGSSPHIKSGAVSALSVLVYSDANICLSVPDLVPSVLTLLQSKDVEVTKAVLGFVKVFVSSIQAKDLHNLLSDIVNGVLPWSSVSRHHFRSKVTVIVEILMRKCGVAAVKSVAAEKYKNFLKTVSENRHGKSSSREDGTHEMESTPSDSRQHKRKDRESNDSLKEKDSRGPHKRKKRKEDEKDSSTNFAKEGGTGGKIRKREMKRKYNTTDEPYFSSSCGAGRKLGKRKREFGHRKQEGDKAPPQKRDKGGKLERGFLGKGKTDRQKRPNDDARGSGAASIPSKRKGGQNRRQKTNKNS